MSEPIRHTDYRDERPYHDQVTGLRYAVLEQQRLVIDSDTPSEAEQIIEPCLRHARHEGMVRLAAQRGYALGGTSILEAKARGDIPRTAGYTGPVVA